VFPGWLQPIFVVSWMIVLELTMYMAGSPGSTGRVRAISEGRAADRPRVLDVAVGPIGLVLGTPLTICLAVLGKYIPGSGRWRADRRVTAAATGAGVLPAARG
jgi:hypothetical protein